ncbi:MAG: class C sortase [Ruminococcus sp.]
MKKFFSFLLVLLFVIGVCLVGYPTVSNIINEITNKSYYKKFDNAVKTMSDNEKYNTIVKARQYNGIITSKFFSSELSSKYGNILSQYDDILNFGNGIMAYIEIPKINVNLPVYHETVNDALTKGAVHLKNSSFPIGENNCHTLISAHSGYPHAKFFDDLDELQNGDIFVLRYLDNKLYYRVTDINIVLPKEMQNLKMTRNKDLITLITCYPYSVNTHRLLVTGERFYPDKYKSSNRKTENTVNTENIKATVITAVILFMLYILITVRRFKNGR